MSSPTDYEPIYRAIGRIAAHWAFIEMALNQCVHLTYQKCGGDQLEDEVPRELRRRLDYLKKILRMAPELSQFVDAGVAMASDIKILSAKRHKISHCAIMDLTEDGSSIQFVSLDSIKKEAIWSSSVFSLDQLLQLSDQVTNVALASAAFASQLTNALAGAQTGKPKLQPPP